MARDSSRGGRGKDQSKTEFPSIKLVSCPVRLSYPSIFDPKKNDQGADVWETDALVKPGKEGKAWLDKLEDALYKVMEDYFGPEDEWPSGKTDGHPSEKIRKIDPDKVPGAGVTADWFRFSARSYSPVGVVDADRNDVLNKREAYGGRWARLSLTVTVYDNKSKGPAIYLNNVQLLDNDESFGGRPNAADEFDRWDGEDLSEGRGRERDDDRSESRGDVRRGSRDEAGSRGERGRGDGGRSRDDGRGGDRAGAREARDEGRSNRDGVRDSRGARRGDEGPSRGGDRDGSGGSRRGSADRDRESDRDRGDSRSRGDGGRGSRDREDDSRGRGERSRGRDDDRDRDREDRDTDSREARGSRGASGSGRRDSRDDREDDRPSGRGRYQDEDDDWN